MVAYAGLQRFRRGQNDDVMSTDFQARWPLHELSKDSEHLRREWVDTS